MRSEPVLLEAGAQRPSAELGGQRLSPLGRPVPDRDRGAGPDECPDDGARRSAGAEHKRLLSGRRLGERVEEAGRVRVLGLHPPVREAERVRGPDRHRRSRCDSSASASAASLCGTVTLAPTKPSPGIARTRVSNSSGETSIAS